VLAAAFHACLSGVMIMPASQITGLLICGMLAGYYPATPSKNSSLAIQWGFLPGLLMSAALLALGAYELQTMERRSKLFAPGLSMNPRIWQEARVCRYYLPENVGIK